MDLVPSFAALTLRPLLEGTVRSLRGRIGSDQALETARTRVLGFLADPRSDLAAAVRLSCDRGWSTLELGLAGPDWWARTEATLSKQNEGPLIQQLLFFFHHLDRRQLPLGHPDFCLACVQELQTARRAGTLSGSTEAGTLSRLSVDLVRPGQGNQADRQTLQKMASALAGLAYPNLAEALRLQAQQGQSLLLDAARQSLYLAYKANPLLSHNLVWGETRILSRQQEMALAASSNAFSSHGPRLQQLLGGESAAVDPGVAQALDVTVEQRYQKDRTVQDLFHKVVAVGTRLGLLHRDLTLADSLSLQDPNDNRLVNNLVIRYRGLADDLKRGTPALCLMLGKLLMVAGEFIEARQFFRGAATLAVDAPGQALAFWCASRAALERDDGDQASKLLEEAVRLDPRTYAPFPVGKYHPVRALGASGLGISYQCWHKQWKADVVVKSLLTDDLDRPADQVLEEAAVQAKLDHPSLMTILDSGWTRADVKTRPFIVRAFFDGTTLEDLAGRTPLSPDDWIEVAIKIAEGMRTLHANGIIHRDLKPANVYVRKDDTGWQVKIINAGLGWRPDVLRPAAFLPTLRGNSLASSRACAPPEVLGEASGAEPGPRSDVYRFAKTCGFALLGTLQPQPQQWGSVPRGILDLLFSCLQVQPSDRLPDFNAILDRLYRLKQKMPADPAPVEAVTEPPPVPQQQPELAAGWRWLPRPKDEPDPHEEHDAKLTATPHGWPIVAARVRGKKHKHEGTHCDDWFEVERAGQWSIIAVSDGAGSRKFSRVGARAICQAAVKRLADVLGQRDLRKRDGGSVEKWYDPQSGLLMAEDLQFVQEAVIGTMEATAEVLRKTAETRASSVLHEKALGRKFEVDDLSATLLLAVHNCLKIDGQEYSFVVTSHVGDGMMAALLPDGKAQPLAKPDSGEHAGETDFVTGKGKLERKNLQGKTFMMFKPMRALLVMTDGVADDYFPAQPGMEQLFGDLVLNRVIRYPEWEKSSGASGDKEKKAREACEQMVPVPTEKGVIQEKIRSAAVYAEKLGVSVEDLVKTPDLMRGGCLPPWESPEPSADQAMLRWLDGYTVRGSFDDRTLVVLHRPQT